MQTAQRETPEQQLDRVLDLNPPLVEEVTRKDICAKLEISLGKIVDIVGNYPHLKFPTPIKRGHGGTLIYDWHAVQAWVALNPIDKILWTQSEKVEKPIIGLDPLLAMAFITGRYDPEERQLDNMRRRIAARSVIRRRGGAAL